MADPLSPPDRAWSPRGRGRPGVPLAGFGDLQLGGGKEAPDVGGLGFHGSGSNKKGQEVAVMISKDHGATWSKPITVAKALPGFVADPDDGTLNAVPNAVPASAGLPSISLEMGQITARGLLYTDANRDPIAPIRFAITGGTDFYRLARGEITEDPTSDTRLLDIQLYSLNKQ